MASLRQGSFRLFRLAGVDLLLHWSWFLARKIHDFRNTEGLAMVQIRYLGGFETKSEAFT